MDLTFVDFSVVVAVGYGVEHALRIATVRVEFGAQADAVGDHARVLSRNGARLFRVDVDSCAFKHRLDFHFVFKEPFRKHLRPCVTQVSSVSFSPWQSVSLYEVARSVPVLRSDTLVKIN